MKATTTTAPLPSEPEEVGVGADGVPTLALEPWLLELGAGKRIAAAAAAPKTTPALAAAAAWATDPHSGWSLLLSGNVGTGKTVAACACLRYAVEAVRYYESDGRPVTRYQPLRAKFTSAQALAEIGFAEGWERRLFRLAEVPWLVVDDLGRERRSDLWQARLDELVNARWANLRRTVLTSNLSFERLARPVSQGGYGSRLADRLRDGRVYGIGGTSLRGKT